MLEYRWISMIVVAVIIIAILATVRTVAANNEKVIVITDKLVKFVPIHEAKSIISSLRIRIALALSHLDHKNCRYISQIAESMCIHQGPNNIYTDCDCDHVLNIIDLLGEMQHNIPRKVDLRDVYKLVDLIDANRVKLTISDNYSEREPLKPLTYNIPLKRIPNMNPNSCNEEDTILGRKKQSRDMSTRNVIDVQHMGDSKINRTSYIADMSTVADGTQSFNISKMKEEIKRKKAHQTDVNCKRSLLSDYDHLDDIN